MTVTALTPTAPAYPWYNRTVTVYLIVVAMGTAWLFFPFLRWLTGTWQALFQDTFGYLVPLVSIGIIVTKRKDIRSLPLGASPWGWAFFVTGLFLALWSRYNDLPALACLSLPIYLYGLCLLFWGPARARLLVFPIFFCFFLYPWDTLVESAIGFHLRLLATHMAFAGLKAVGLGAGIWGTAIDTGRFVIDVVPACSGLTLLKVLFFFGAMGAYLYPGKYGYKVAFWASTIPLAVVLNAGRIASVGLIGHWAGADIAGTFFHQGSGLLFFGLALMALYGEAGLLKRLEGNT